jgi:hypothetical protein
MKTATSPVSVTAEDNGTSVTATLADLRRRSSVLADAIQKAADLYWQLVDEQAEIDSEAQQIEDHVTYLESLVKYRDMSHRSRRKHKKFQRRAVCQHRSNGLASMSDSTHVTLVLKGKRKAKRDRECDKTTTRIRKAQLRKQAERGLNPAEILSIPECRREREAYYAEVAESRRIAIIAACTSPDAVNQNLNGECHDHYTV